MPTRSIRPLAVAVIVLLAAQIGLLVFRALAFIHRIDLLQKIKRGAFVTKDQADASDRLVAQSSLLWALVFLAGGIVWLVWQHHAQRNAQALTHGGASVTPGWAVGWWFVPFANLVKPFQAVHELWRASAGGESWRDQHVSPVLIGWWLTWLAFNLVGLFALGERTSVGRLISADQVRLAAMLFGIASAGSAIWVVRSILTRQELAIAIAAKPDLPPAPIPLPPAPLA